MKIIDKTSLLDEKGQLSFINRIQGMLKYGMSWPAELDAQQKVIAQLDRVLEKGFVLIRNFTLPNSEIVIPMILIGPGGVTVMYVTTVKGFYEAKGDQWNSVVNGASKPAAINLLNRVFRYARAVQMYMERQRIDLPVQVEPVLIAADPGAHIESMRPTARVVMSDAIKQFATSLLQARPVWRTDMAYGLADQVIEPRPPQEVAAAQQKPAESPTAASRAQAIFNAAEQAQPFDTGELGFAFEEEGADESQPSARRDPQAQRPGQPPRKRGLFGMTTAQVVILGVMLVCQVFILIGAAFFLLNP